MVGEPENYDWKTMVGESEIDDWKTMVGDDDRKLMTGIRWLGNDDFKTIMAKVIHI